MQSHEIDYRIIDEQRQIVEVWLDPDETVIAESGAFLAKGPQVKLETRISQTRDKGLAARAKNMTGVAKRMLAGEDLFLTHFTSTAGRGKQRVLFAAPYPGDIIPVDLAAVGGSILCQSGAFLAGAHGTTIEVALVKRLTAGLFGGEGFLLQRVKGDGLLLLHAGGSHYAIKLDDQELHVDTGSLVAFEEGIKYQVVRAGGVRSMLFSGEGIFLAKLRGTGWVWVQSLPLDRLAEIIGQEIKRHMDARDKKKQKR